MVVKIDMSKLLGSKKYGNVGDELRKHLAKGASVSILSGLFSIYAFESLKKELNRIKDARLIRAHTPVENDVSSETLFPHLLGNRFERRFRNQLNQARVAGDCARWIEDKAEIRTVRDPDAINQNLFHIQNATEKSVAVQGSSHFTSSGLGYAESDGIHMNMLISDAANASATREFFDNLWNDSQAVKDAGAPLLEQLEQIVQDQSPEFIYFRSLLEIAVRNIAGKSEEKGVESLFSRGGTHLSKNSFQGMDDFEVISYMIVSAP